MTTKIFNPQSKNLIVLSVKLRETFETIKYLFPLNPGSLSISQANRVSATFTYGAKVFQNLGAGLKTISIEGHTGYRLDPYKYGIQGGSSELAFAAAVPIDSAPGKALWLDLYALVQLMKGENKYLPKYSTVKSEFLVGNMDLIDTVQITIPDQGITYDVILQNDNFMRNREQPHLYKYKLDFIVTQESLGTPLAVVAIADKIPDVGGLTASIKRQANLLKSVKTQFMAIPGIQTVAKYYDDAVKYVNQSVEYGNFFINTANSTINDLRRLERMTDALNGVTKNLGLLRLAVNQIKSFSDLRTAFYEPYIRLKNISMQMSLLKKSMTGDQQNLQFNVNLTRLASISAPVTLAANKATVAQFQKDIRQLTRIAFPFPIDRVEEVTVSGIKKINVFFKSRPSALGISDIKIFAPTDFGNENNLVESYDDNQLVMSTNYDEMGYIYNFLIEYNFTSFESVVQSKYKSIKRILIQNGETMDSLIKKYSPKEANASRTYISEVAYLNEIEYPYIVTSDNDNFDAYFGSYGYKIFSTNGEFMQYINNIDVTLNPGVVLPSYSSTEADSTSFLLQQQEVIDQIKTGDRFFVLLFKETYSNRCYAVFGVFLATNVSACKLFNASSYVICALEKGRSYDIENNSIFEILSPYTASGDLIDYYGQTDLFDSITDPDIDLFDKLVTVIDSIYVLNVGSFTSGTFPFTEADKTFLAGESDNSNYVILTNFTATGASTISSYSITAFSTYHVLTDGQEILLPSFENTFLPFAEAFTKEDTYKVDLDARFEYLDDQNISILPRSDLRKMAFSILIGTFTEYETLSFSISGATGTFISIDDTDILFLLLSGTPVSGDIISGTSATCTTSGAPREDQGYLEFKLIYGIDNIKQALKNRLECPQGGLILHKDYGLPVLLGKKNTLEHLILLRYNLFNQLMSDSRVKSTDDIQISGEGDVVKAQASVILVNNDDVLIKTTL